MPKQIFTNDRGTILTETFVGQYAKIPLAIQTGLVNYITHRRPTCMFLRKILTNRLDAVLFADEESVAGIREIYLWVYNNAPSNCWGDDFDYRAWINEEEEN